MFDGMFPKQLASLNMIASPYTAISSALAEASKAAMAKLNAMETITALAPKHVDEAPSKPAYTPINDWLAAVEQAEVTAAVDGGAGDSRGWTTVEAKTIQALLQVAIFRE
eukprot:8702200-Pyramimonas_sp.AAC.1